jgi:hypothetical protein
MRQRGWQYSRPPPRRAGQLERASKYNPRAGGGHRLCLQAVSGRAERRAPRGPPRAARLFLSVDVSEQGVPRTPLLPHRRLLESLCRHSAARLESRPKARLARAFRAAGLLAARRALARRAEHGQQEAPSPDYA